jgi:hypothetical protein
MLKAGEEAVKAYEEIGKSSVALRGAVGTG